MYFHRLIVYVNDREIVIHLYIDDEEWHYLVVTWSSQVGVWQVFVDGVMEAGDAGFMPDELLIGKT